ncbi:Rad2 nuclease [Perkinsus chesapeaki]|uniref:Rad2 nuclease n=1 Tax=Perkinsus chesapeaki TaxID=330153 RepID=A0A7J6MNY6_PERCH|nr:Rad2 nuclease [Perkinsus chesapeaki]
MGINGLLKTLEQLQRPISQDLSDYRDKRVAVDTYVWLHRGLQAGNAAMDVVTGKATSLHLNYCVRRLEALLASGVAEVILARELGLEYRKAGNYGAARKMFTRAADVSPEMAADLIALIRSRDFGPRVRWIVAPYEADAQLAYLALNGLVDAVISEDSDLLPFGCPHVVYKLDLLVSAGRARPGCRSGVSIALPSRMLPEGAPNSQASSNDDVGDGVCRFSRDSFLHYCVLAGCDYLPSVTGMGPKKAYGFVLRGGPNISRIMNLAQIAGFEFPEGYADMFERAILTFRHQTVWCPLTRKLRPLLDLDDTIHYPTETRQFWGRLYSNPEAEQVADGLLHPETKMPFRHRPLPPVRAAHVRCGKWTQKQQPAAKSRRSSISSSSASRQPVHRVSSLEVMFKASEHRQRESKTLIKPVQVECIDLDAEDSESQPPPRKRKRSEEAAVTKRMDSHCLLMQVVREVSEARSPFLANNTNSRVSLPVSSTNPKLEPVSLTSSSPPAGEARRTPRGTGEPCVAASPLDHLNEFRNPDGGQRPRRQYTSSAMERASSIAKHVTPQYRVITIVGGGNSGHICASLVHGNTRGQVRVQLLTSKPEVWTTTPVVRFPDGSCQEGKVDKVSSDPNEVLPNSDLVLWTGPVNATKEVGASTDFTGAKSLQIFEAIKPFVNIDRTVVGTIFAQGLVHVLAQRVFGPDVKFFALRNIPWLCRTISVGRECEVVGPKSSIECALINLPPQWIPVNLQPLFLVRSYDRSGPTIEALEDFCPIVFNPANQIIHPATYWGLFRKWLPGKPLRGESKPRVWLYRGMDELSGQILEALDEELQDIKTAYFKATGKGERRSHTTAVIRPRVLPRSAKVEG